MNPQDYFSEIYMIVDRNTFTPHDRITILECIKQCKSIGDIDIILDRSSFRYPDDKQKLKQLLSDIKVPLGMLYVLLRKMRKSTPIMSYESTPSSIISEPEAKTTSIGKPLETPAIPISSELEAKTISRGEPIETSTIPISSELEAKTTSPGEFLETPATPIISETEPETTESAKQKLLQKAQELSEELKQMTDTLETSATSTNLESLTQSGGVNKSRYYDKYLEYKSRYKSLKKKYV